jgi:predicted RNA-binding protein YlxR (DUF448 family)
MSQPKRPKRPPLRRELGDDTLPGREPTERMCIVTRDVGPVDGLIRFVLDPEGMVVADLKRQLPGRGVWVGALYERVAEAARRGLFAKAFDEPAKAAPELADMVGDRLGELALGQIGLARKAGAVVTGFAKVEAAIAAGKALAVLHASDASADGVRKLEAASRRSGQNPAVFDCFAADQLSLALGGSNVIHAALLAGRAGEGALKRVEALLRYRGAGGRPRAEAIARKAPASTAPEPDDRGQKRTND